MKTIAIYDAHAYMDGYSLHALGPIERWSPLRAAPRAFERARVRGDVMLLPEDSAEALALMRRDAVNFRCHPFTRLVPSWLPYDKFASTFYRWRYAAIWTTYELGENAVHSRVAPRIDDVPERVFCHPVHAADTSKIMALSAQQSVIVRRQWLAEFDGGACIVRCQHRHSGPGECWLHEALS